MSDNSAYKPLTIVAYTADEWDHVCPSIRIVEPLTKAGFNLVRGSDWENNRLTVALEPIQTADYVLIQRDFPGRSEAYAEIIAKSRKRNIPVIYDLDDLLIELPDSHPDGDHYQIVGPRILQAILDADVITTSTNDLRNFLSQFNPNISLLHNCLIDSYWPVSSINHPIPEYPITIGYMAGHSHIPDLEMILPVLNNLISKYGSRIRFIFWGIHPTDKFLEHSNVSWTHPYLVSYREFAQYFLKQQADIFIAPLVDNQFNRCKSALKYVEYSRMGIPGIYSQLPAYEEIISQGQNGYLAGSLADWENYLSLLIEDADKRGQIGRAAQDTIEANWLLSNNAYRWRDAILNADSKGHEKVAAEFFQKANQYIGNRYVDLAEKHIAVKATAANLSQQIAVNEAQIYTLSLKLDNVTEQLLAMKSSYSWKTIENVNLIRSKIIPNGSLGERTIKLAFRGLSTWRNLGYRVMIRRMLAAISRRTSASALQTVENHSRILFHTEAGENHPDPLLSVIVEDTAILQQVMDWVERQTYRSVDILVWNRGSGVCRNYSNQQFLQQAYDIKSLKQIIRGRYVCFASADLLDQPGTYLETNLAALEGERLIFTLNVHWQTADLLETVQSLGLPGNSTHPYFRHFIRKDYLEDSFRINFAGFPSNQVVGKILFGETTKTDYLADWPFEGETSPNFEVDGNYIIYSEKGLDAGQSIPHVIHPVNTVLSFPRIVPEKPVILVAIQFLAVGGAEKLLLNVMDSLKDDFCFVIISVERQADPLGTSADSFRKITPYVYSVGYFLNQALYFSFFEHIIGRFHPQTLYIANGSTWIYDALGELKKHFQEIRMINQVYDHQIGWINRYDPVVAKSLDGHIAANPKISTAYIEKGANPKQVFLIGHGIDMDELNPEHYTLEMMKDTRHKLGLPLDKKMIVFAGRIHPQKRPMDFVELARRSENDESLHFLMVGEGPLSGVVDDYIKDNHPKNLTKINFYRPIMDIFSFMDVLVLPSEYEGMPLVILEALAMGKPVVVTDVGSNKDVVGEANGGVVIPRIGDVKALYDGIQQVLNHPIDPIKVRECIRERFGMETISKQYRKAWLGVPDA